MEFRKISLCLALVILAVFSQCSEARHARHRRETDDSIFGDDVQADEATDDEAQNDDGGNDADEEVNASILTLPEKYHVHAGKAVQLACKLSVAPDMAVVSWYKDDVQFFLGSIKMNAHERASIAPGSSDLVIRDLVSEDSGRYRCQVQQEDNASIEHTLEVVESQAPKIVQFTASSRHLKEGDNLELTCNVVGAPKPQIIWSRVSLSGENRKLTEKDGTFTPNSFTARNVTKEMAGTYYCYAVNNKMNSSQAALTITITGKPRVHVHRAVVNSAIGVEAVLQCSAHEEPAPYIKWYKDGTPIEDVSTRYSISTIGTNSNLTVTPSKDEDFGTFTCEAQNEYGIHSRSIDLVESPVVENVDVDGPKLTWTVHSHQPLEDIELQLRGLNEDAEYKVLKVPIPESANRHSYEIVYVLENQQVQPGKYEATIKVKNEKQWSKHTDPAIVNIDDHAEPIQTASVFRGNNAHTTRPTLVAMATTTFIYLLVRML